MRDIEVHQILNTEPRFEQVINTRRERHCAE